MAKRRRGTNRVHSLIYSALRDSDHAPLRLGAPVSVCRHLNLAHRVFLDTELNPHREGSFSQFIIKHTRKDYDAEYVS